MKDGLLNFWVQVETGRLSSACDGGKCLCHALMPSSPKRSHTHLCRYRVSYTCLGDAVNLASRLEALNKKFGTFICVSHATYVKAADEFHFRMLGNVTVPGKSEVLAVFEVLAAKTVAQAVEDGLHHDVNLISNLHQDDNDPANKYCMIDLDDHADTARTDSASDTTENSHFDWDDVVMMPSPGCSSGGPSPGYSPAASVGSRRHKEQVVYHWRIVDLHELLLHARLYECTYNALVQGDLKEAGQHLLKTSSFTSDKAWQMLMHQHENQVSNNILQWNGVFNFCEK